MTEKTNLAQLERENDPEAVKPVCYCGAYLDDHGYGDTHTPVEMPQQARASSDDVLRLVAAARVLADVPAIHHVSCKWVDDHELSCDCWLAARHQVFRDLEFNGVKP